MLKKLTVWNFALIRHIQIDFTSGLNIITGETGAGKSLLLGALSLLMGQRANINSIRNDADYLRIEAVVMINSESIHAFLANNAILDDNDEIIVMRQINKNGKNIIQINGCQVPLVILKTLGELMIDIHGQNENQSLLRPQAQLDLLDKSIADFKQYNDKYYIAYNKYNNLKDKLEQKQLAAQNYSDRLDMLRWQSDEIENIAIKPEEAQEIEEKIKKLSNYEKIADLVKITDDTLSNNADDITILSAISLVQKNLETLLKYDNHFENAKKIIDDAYIQLQEVSYDIREYADDIDFNPNELNNFLRRSDDIERICRKYGPTVEDVLNYQQKIRQELDEIENYDTIIKQLQIELNTAETKLGEIAAQIKKMRKTAAESLAKKIKKQLLDLGMANAQIVIAVHDLKEYTLSGTESVQIMFNANLGEEIQPLAKVASGGELSRIALAIKTVTAVNDDIGIMVFD